MLIFMPNKKNSTLKKLSPMGTPQGQNTLISLLICAILGMVLSRILPALIAKLQPNMRPEDAQEIGVLIALGVSGVVLVISLLRPKKNASPLHRQLLKKQEKSDGNR